MRRFVWWALFQTWIGEIALEALERWLGLAVVPVEYLGTDWKYRAHSDTRESS
jgi:hypothetical protein